MLVEFRVKNYKSFRDEQVFSMVASHDKEMSENTMEVPTNDKLHLLRSGVVFGPNASGKSNLIDALAFVRTMVTASVQLQPKDSIPIQPFQLNSDSPTQPSEFEITFIQDKVRYQYGFVVDQTQIREEWLIAYPQTRAQIWFERQWDDKTSQYIWYYGPYLKGERKRLETLTKPNTLFLSVAAAFNHEQLTQVYRWFSESLWVVDVHSEAHVMEQHAARLAQNGLIYDLIKTFLRMTDVGLVDFTVRAITRESEQFPNDWPVALHSFYQQSATPAYKISLHHQAKDDSGQPKILAWEEESLGTRRLFAISILWVEAMLHGRVLCLDELGANLHPSILRTLISLFSESKFNQNGSQVIFTAHDVALLDSGLFRRDQIWLIEKDHNGASHLYPLLQFKPRKGEALMRGYMQGRYGAIPMPQKDLLSQ